MSIRALPHIFFAVPFSSLTYRLFPWFGSFFIIQDGSSQAANNVWHLFICLFEIYCQHVSQADLDLSVPSTSTEITDRNHCAQLRPMIFQGRIYKYQLTNSSLEILLARL